MRHSGYYGIGWGIKYEKKKNTDKIRIDRENKKKAISENASDVLDRNKKKSNELKRRPQIEPHIINTKLFPFCKVRRWLVGDSWSMGHTTHTFGSQ